MIIPSYKQRLEVSKKVLYTAIGQEAIKLEAIWYFSNSLHDFEMGLAATKTLAYLVDNYALKNRWRHKLAVYSSTSRS